MNLYIQEWVVNYSDICVMNIQSCWKNVKIPSRKAAKLIVELETKFIDKMFEMGDLENLKADDLKEFIKERTNTKLKELGYEPIFEFDKNKSQNLEWFYHLRWSYPHHKFSETN